MKNITLCASPARWKEVRQAITLEERLDELVATTDNNTDALIHVEDNKLHISVQWDTEYLPVLFPADISYSEKTLLGLIFFFLGNYEKSAFYFSNYPEYLRIIELGHALQHGFSIADEEAMSLSAGTDKHSGLHNIAVAFHYASAGASFRHIQDAYSKALQQDTFSERLAFTAKQYATYLSDAGQFTQASEILLPFVYAPFLSQQATFAIKTLLCHIEVKRLKPQCDETWMIALKNDLWECLKYYETHNRWSDAAFILMDAAYVATRNNSFSEALGYIQKAGRYFEQEDLTELAAQALIQKADLLINWAQNGNPQFYREAMKTCQETLKIFNREKAPGIFADIHHKLGVIYSEIPDDVKRKSIWAAVSVSSFSEALNFYNKLEYPYEFGMICNNQANAFTKYPQAIHSDNFDKALAWYREALNVRDAEKYPAERAISLLNYIEAAWHLNIENESDETLYNDMLMKANEVLALSVNEELKTEARRHQEQLKELIIRNY